MLAEKQERIIGFVKATRERDASHQHVPNPDSLLICMHSNRAVVIGLLDLQASKFVLFVICMLCFVPQLYIDSGVTQPRK